MAGYIGTKAALLSTTTASVGGDSTVGGDLTVDTDTLYVDSANNRVGIGNTSPTQALDVTGDIITSGGVYLGGTGSANHLDDYEEGTWTPAVSSGSVTVNKATYTKVGNLVMVQMDVTLGGTRSASTFSVSGLPFVNGSGRWTAISMYHGASIGSHQQVVGVVNQGNGVVTFQRMGGDAVGTEFSNAYLNIGGTYMTD